MHAKQERVESFNYLNDTVFLSPVYLSFETKYLIYRTPISTPYCL